MAKAIIEYDLTDSDDQLEFERAAKSLDMALALWEFAYNTKKKLVWELESNKAEQAEYDLLDKVYGKFWEIVKAHNIDLDKLIV